MKRFLVVAVLAVMLAASVAWAQEWVTCTGTTAGYCMWDACYSIASGPPPDGKATCTEAYKNCLDNSKSHTVYSDDGCKTVKEKGGIESCGEYCQWDDDCWEIQTDPDGDNGTKTTNCTEAKANCDTNGSGRYTGTTTTGKGVTCDGTLVGGGVAQKCGYYCKWETGCYEIKPDPTGANGTASADCEEAIANCDKDGARYDNSSCSGTQVGGDESCGGYCKWESGCEAIKTDKNGQYGPVVSTCSEAIENCDRDGTRYTDASCNTPAVGVKFIANAAKIPGLKVSYAKNRVSVNWTPATKIAKGTVQLINAKGVALSTAFIKDNSSKVSVKLGTVGVPAGMYFIHINAVGQNGKKIVTQSAISIVK